MNYRAFVERAKVIGAGLYADVVGDADPFPQAMLETPKGITIALIDPGFMESGSSKNLLALQMASEAKREKARKVAWFLPTWSIAVDPLRGQSAPLPDDFSTDPRRKEALVVVAIDRERVESWQAFIERRGADQHPELSDWEDWGTQGADGRFVGVVQEALR